MHPYLYFNLRKWYHIASCFQYSSFLRSGCVNASLIAQLVTYPPAMQETPFQFLIGKIHWRRDRLPTPIFLGSPSGSAGKESTCS